MKNISKKNTFQDREMAQLSKCLLSKYQDLSADLHHVPNGQYNG